MKTAAFTLAGVLTLSALAYSATQRNAAAPQASGGAATANDNAQKSGDLLAAGRELFVKRCASCHNERGDKPLSSGAPLSERALTREQMVRNVNGRLRAATEEERRGVVLYIESFMKKRE